MKQVTIFLLIFACTCNTLHAQNHGGRADDHAPIGVMGDHTHHEGEGMLSYRYMFMDMDGNRSGSNRVSTQDVLNQFMVSPEDMDMHMHMLGAMYAPTDSLTLMLMIPFIELSMNHQTRSGMRFKTRTQALGDISLTGLIKVWNNDDHFLHLNAGVSLPSGEIDSRDDTPAGAQMKLPYPMQAGSGTVDLLPGITYRGYEDAWSWGAQLRGTIRLGENDNDYTLGNRVQTTAWLGYLIAPEVSTSLRVNYERWGNIDGADPDLNPMMVPTADPDRRGGSRFDLGFGVTTLAFEKSRLAVELLLPTYQDLDGPQLETDLQLIIGLQQSF